MEQEQACSNHTQICTETQALFAEILILGCFSKFIPNFTLNSRCYHADFTPACHNEANFSVWVGSL
ncbi:MAG TPA: hypothetical protein DEH25_17095 [Chloroflexi bacterium]|nr:hypothetical protein [Chloroflexota bacterium]